MTREQAIKIMALRYSHTEAKVRQAYRILYGTEPPWPDDTDLNNEGH